MPYVRICDWTSHTKSHVPLDGKAFRHAMLSEDEVTIALWWDDEQGYTLDILRSIGDQTGEGILDLLHRLSTVSWVIVGSVSIDIRMSEVFRDNYAYMGHAAIAEIDNDTLSYLILAYPDLIWSNGECDWEWATV